MKLTYLFIVLFGVGFNSDTVMQTAKYKLDFYTQYNQFYLFDKNSPGRTGDDGFWTNEAFDERLAVEEGILGVGTQSYGHIKADLILLKQENKTTIYTHFDHVVEGSIEIKSGFFQIVDCPNSKVELELQLKPGIYRAKIYSSNLRGTISDENEGKDHYLIEIWPDSYIDRKVLKQFKEE